jgi:5-methylcytosine-specific restriction endonuclease McrA
VDGLMKKHTKIYLNYFGYTIADFIPCESCGSQAVDIHHIKARGMGGSKERDNIENLMALCRYCHDKMGDTKTYREFLEEKHKEKMNNFNQ